MAIGFDFRQELYGPWETAQGALIEQFDRLYASLSVIQPLLSLATLPASSVLVTDTIGSPSFGTTLPYGISFGSGTTGVSRADGSQIIPPAYSTQAVSSPTANKNQLAHSFLVVTNVDIPGSSTQVLEGYNFMKGSGTTAIGICVVGNAENGGTGTIADVRSVQGGGGFSSTGGGTHFKCFFAAPSGRIFGGSGTYTNGYGFHCGTFGSGFTNKYALFSQDTTAGIFLTSDVAVKATTNTWQVTSDARVKRDVHPFTDGLWVLLGLDPVHYTYNGLGDTRDGDQGIGVIAQAAQTVAPYLVKSRQASDAQTYLTVDTGDLTWVLVNAIKELDARVHQLEAL